MDIFNLDISLRRILYQSQRDSTSVFFMAVSQPPPPGRKEPGHVREDVLGELEGGRLVRADGGNHRGSDGFDMI
jgi:hypothetical protein